LKLFCSLQFSETRESPIFLVGWTLGFLFGYYGILSFR
jgi:hypothetical protein